ncbi:unnamed protein product [Bursaphelenchus okinawaensis]|uniref:Uncharacterized protein n=1 Tax=Bursaphelenchus okinawaensis TaxID=465554 RepID=A0A811KP65_9BILA|nr:unnamed protein product [Bursaphelenchus okinawaensis]CAG9106746.1 unnamed protein product [Bursaphelenchus okinawaensis]
MTEEPQILKKSNKTMMDVTTVKPANLIANMENLKKEKAAKEARGMDKEAEVVAKEPKAMAKTDEVKKMTDMMVNMDDAKEEMKDDINEHVDKGLKNDLQATAASIVATTNQNSVKEADDNAEKDTKIPKGLVVPKSKNSDDQPLKIKKEEHSDHIDVNSDSEGGGIVTSTQNNEMKLHDVEQGKVNLFDNKNEATETDDTKLEQAKEEKVTNSHDNPSKSSSDLAATLSSMLWPVDTAEATTAMPNQVISFFTPSDQTLSLDSQPKQLLQKVTKLDLQNPGKIIGLTVRTGQLLHVTKSHGEIDILNSTSFEFLRSLHTMTTIHRIGYFEDGKMVVNEALNSTLNVYDVEGRVIDQIGIDYQVLDLQVLDDKIYVLSRTDATVYVYDKELDLTSVIRLSETPKESCNFILPTESAIFYSCQSAILKATLNGTIVASGSIPGGSYSLALLQNGNEVWAAQRGRAEFHVYNKDELKFVRRLVVDSEETALWSNVVKNDDLLYCLDYVINSISVYRI